MKIEKIQVSQDDRATKLREWLHAEHQRLGLITSIDGSQLITMTLDTKDNRIILWETPVDGATYKSITSFVPQAHWYERSIWDMFGMKPEGHPRLKHNLLHEPYDPSLFPLHIGDAPKHANGHRNFHPLEVKGTGIYELPVGPIHAGVIEPGHFRFSLMGEIILNLEIHLGYVHRGVKKRLTEVPWRKARFVAEAAASDMPVANALAHAVAIENLFGVEVPTRANALRTVALEIERIAMHIIDLGGLGGDIGFLAISSSMARMRGVALGMGELLSGSRFMRAYVCPGGVVKDPGNEALSEIKQRAIALRKDLKKILQMFLPNQAVCERMQKTGRVSPQLAKDFGFVGIGGRASGSGYDARQHFPHGLYPQMAPPVVTEPDGDVYSRANVRAREIMSSLDVIENVCATVSSGDSLIKLPDMLPASATGAGIVESHRGELIHLIFTGEMGEVKRYAIKDASVNNWTALAIAVRKNVVADFPLCNKSFALSYSGHDL